MINIYKKIFHELDIKKLESYIEKFSVCDYICKVINKEFLSKSIILCYNTNLFKEGIR